MTKEQVKEKFLSNSYYKGMYEKATDKVKQWLENQFVYSLYPEKEKGEQAQKEMRNIEKDFETKDWDNLIEISDNRLAKAIYRARKEGKEVQGDAIYNIEYHE